MPKPTHITPSYFAIAFKIALFSNIVSVVFNVINDCDETYNYWEPLHFLLTDGHGGGFQTWEYSPSYALRSYLFLWLFGWPGYVVKWFAGPGWLAFLLVRLHLALISAYATSLLAYTISRYSSAGKNSGIPLSLVFVGFYALSPGNFLASSTLVPSGIAASLCALMLSFWLSGHYFLAVGCVAFMGIVVWPFAALIGLPLAVYMTFTGKLSKLLRSSLLWSALLVPPMTIVDSYYFGRIVLAPLNIIKYNILSPVANVSGSASQLYGTEPLSFYLKNYVLNFNIAFPFACLFVIFGSVYILWHIIFRMDLRNVKVQFACTTSLVIWNLVFLVQEHKEERFLFPCYPCLVLGAALCFYHLVLYLSSFSRWDRLNSFVAASFAILFIAIFVALSASRIAALTRWYSSPIYLIRHLPDRPLERAQKSLLCLGRDWHYFPSRFILPGGGENWELGYLRSNFSGQLPGQYMSVQKTGGVVQSTRTDGSKFNADNVEENDRYVMGGPSACDFILDRDSTPGDREELYIANKAEWVSVSERSVLEPHKSKIVSSLPLIQRYPFLCAFFRAFYVPFISETLGPKVSMHILQRRKVF
ncbi:unnamed protein product [Calicophoron daubneyi]|uniref:Mannosyltransferase n=1 Tax=Calicophoron daubneyi TaxID=300641 RepID=A0AAV2T6F4_CALDB